MTVGQRICERRKLLGMTQEELAIKSGYRSKSTINKIELGINDVNQTKLARIAAALGTTSAALMGWTPDDGFSADLPSPIVTNKVVTFPVIGEIAAGFDKIGMEDWTGDTIEIPEAVLHGHDRSDFFVLRVSGDSMYPHYQEGDYVLVLKQSTLNYSGEVGAILYEDELVSLKKIEYVEGEDWLRLVPINPNHPPKRIEGEALAHCRIIGIPRLLIRKL